MKEQIVSFETAKLAKEKGFKEDNCLQNGMYNKHGTIQQYIPMSHNLELQIPDDWYLAPSQTLLQKWLREEHDVHVSPVLNYSIEYPYKPANEEYSYEEDEKWIDIKDYEMVHIATPKKAYELIIDTKTYEEALEQGLQTGLELI